MINKIIIVTKIIRICIKSKNIIFNAGGKRVLKENQVTEKQQKFEKMKEFTNQKDIFALCNNFKNNKNPGS